MHESCAVDLEVDGDAMVHAVYFRDGRASYRSRLVATNSITGITRAVRVAYVS